MSVVGPMLALADAYATAAFAMGERGLAWVARQPGYGGVAITRAGRMAWTSMVDDLLVPAEEPSAGEKPAAR
jgi:thiamine biosynthesis lipoprotein